MTGRARGPWATACLGIATLGIGFAWYYFAAYREVDEDADQRHSPLFFLAFLPFVGPLLGAYYLRHETRNLDAARARVGLSPGLGLLAHVGLFLLGAAVALALSIPAWLALQDTLGADSWLVPAGFVAWLAPAVPVPVLARSINAYWAARAGYGPPSAALK